MPAWVTQGYEEYVRRMPRECLLQLVEVDAEKRSKSGSPQRWIEQESQRVLAAIPPGDHVVALDVRGKSWSTEALARQLQGWMHSGSGVSLLVGGPDGLSASTLQRAQQRWSLSALTLPHPLVRVVLAEQIYRAWSVVNHHPYHRG